MFNWISRKAGQALVTFLDKPVKQYDAFSTVSTTQLEKVLCPGDILLVEGKTRFSAAIKFLTQSTWSHSAMYVGDALKGRTQDAHNVLIEADIALGVIAVPLSKYQQYNVRICRPVGIGEDDLKVLIQYVRDRLGHRYDLKNVIDLVRYLLPTPPVPVRWRRRMLELGSGDPTRAICSTLIAQAFQAIKYPILPTGEVSRGLNGSRSVQARHYSLFTPRDFDLSPYFKVIKPTIECGFSYKSFFS